LLVEVPVIVMAGRGSLASWKVAILTNTATNPVAVLVFFVVTAYLAPDRSSPLMFLLMGTIELVVLLVEWRIFRWTLGWSKRRALITSLVANGLSFGLGLALVSRF